MSETKLDRNKHVKRVDELQHYHTQHCRQWTLQCTPTYCTAV